MAWARQSKTSKLWGGAYRTEPKAKPVYLPCEHRTKTEAARAAAIAEGVARKRPGYDHLRGRTPWGEWCDQWWPTRRLEASTEESQRYSLLRVRKRWDTVPIGSIDRHAIQAWVRELERELTPASLRQPYYILSSSLRAAVPGLIDATPCVGIELPTPPPAQERYLTDVETAGILYHLDEQWRVLVELLLGTGLRIGEASGLHWHRVDLDAGTIHVVETWSRSGSHVKAYPKSGRLRVVPLTGGLVDLLVAWRDRHPDSGSCGRPHVADFYPNGRRRPGAGSCRSSLVITGDQGAPVDSGYFGRTQWRQACRLAGIEHATPHSTRHTYASRLLTAGVPIARVSKLLGHSSIQVTERVYAHLIDDAHDEVRAALEGWQSGDANRDAAGRPSEGQERSTWRRPRAL